MYTPAYLHTFIGCDKTPVLTQALIIQKLNERNDVQCCVPLLVVALHTCIRPERHCHGAKHLRAIRELKNVSWPQKGCCDFISQKLIQHHVV